MKSDETKYLSTDMRVLTKLPARNDSVLGVTARKK
jgi:hypothetical protein